MSEDNQHLLAWGTPLDMWCGRWQNTIDGDKKIEIGQVVVRFQNGEDETICPGYFDPVKRGIVAGGVLLKALDGEKKSFEIMAVAGSEAAAGTTKKKKAKRKRYGLVLPTETELYEEDDGGATG